jgi:DNA-binding response OmpR family regulator
MARKLVLVIDPSWQIRKLIRANLEPLGLHVREAVSAQHGLEQIRDVKPDLILLAADLPHGSSLDLLRSLHTRFAKEPVPIVLISAEPPGRDLLEEIDLAGCLLKPFDVLTLLAKVGDLLFLPPAAQRAS